MTTRRSSTVTCIAISPLEPPRPSIQGSKSTRHNFKQLIEGHCVDVIGPDPLDCGGLAELKWICEHADMHGIQFAPHGAWDGVLGLAALIQVCATLPDNFIAFEYPSGDHDAHDSFW